MIGQLSVAGASVLRVLAEPGTRWHHFDDLVDKAELGKPATRNVLRSLCRHGLAASSPVAGAVRWSITELGNWRLKQLEEDGGR